MTHEQRTIYLTKENAEAARENLILAAKLIGFENITQNILQDEKFFICSGSSKPGQHHYGDYGLILHTHEVLNNAFSFTQINKGLYSFSKEEIGNLILACIFHDSGKTEDYEKENGIWTFTNHKREIHHISRSALNFAFAAEGKLPKERIDAILHAILAHHGRRDYGSPVAPKTRVAYLLHLSDALSARMYDFDTLDRY